LFTLAGMASNPLGDTVEYTAIISDGAGLHFVKPGDTLPGGYTVVDVQETMVTLRDESGGERTLRLR
jgi:acyl dehydratase